MQNSNYIGQLKDCLTPKEVWGLMKGVPYRESESSFEDPEIILPTSIRTPQNCSIKIENTFLDLAFRTLSHIKYEGLIGIPPVASGKIAHHYQLRAILVEIETIQPSIRSMTELKHSTIEKIASSFLESIKKGDSAPSTGYTKLFKLFEWSVFANKFLPPFLQMDESLLSNSSSYKEIKSLHAERTRVWNLGGRRAPYDLLSLKTIIAEAIEYVENYAPDGLLATEIFMNSKVSEDVTSALSYSIAIKQLKNTTRTLKEPSFRKLQKDAKSIKTLYHYDKDQDGVIRNRGRQLKGGVSTAVSYCSKKLEASCTIVILLTTGMRLSEFLLLKRYPEISNDEHYNLKRMVYKTAPTEDGVEHKIPIPEITKKAINILSELSEIKDKGKNDRLFTGSLAFPNTLHPKGRVQTLINMFSSSIGVKLAPTPHQLRHAMAFMIAYANKKDGLEIARMFLKHTSIKMTLNYMGHFNPTLAEAVGELQQEEQEYLVNAITSEVKEGRRLYGAQGQRIMGNHNFTGSYADEFIDLMDRTLTGLMDKGQIAIIQTPVCLCIHDLTSPEEMSCQRGFDIKQFIGEPPKPSRCEGGSCGNALFFESHIEDLEFIPEDDDLRARLEKNRFFVEAGGFENDPFEKVIKQYKKGKRHEEVVNG